jgi:glutamate/tyrosine decarboxylase-like PLP-dependent enzyme
VDPAKLTLDPEEMRRVGYLVIDTLVEHFATLPDKPVARRGTRPALEKQFREPPPETGTDPEALVRRLAGTAFSSHMHVDHPRFFGFVPSPGNFVGAMADALASGFNTFVGTWFAGSGAAEIELVTIDWLRELCGLPETGGGLFVSGGSIANLTGMALARHVRLPYTQERGVLYYSGQTHSSVDRAVQVLGFSTAQIRRIAPDARLRLPLETLEREVACDRAQGRLPFCVVANAGTTNTGAVDPLPALADFCAREGLWLHVDGAYGAAAALTEEGRRELAGLELADSIALDPHKWLFQPFEIGCLLARDRRQLKDAFRVMPEYLRDVHHDQEEVNFCDYGVQLSRGFRALKLWLSMKTFGLAAFRAAIEHGLEMARFAERRLRESGRWEIVTPAQLGIVSFRRSGDDAVTQGLVGAMIDDGFALLTSTVLNGRPALRFCTINPRTTEDDVLRTITRLEELAADGRRWTPIK